MRIESFQSPAVELQRSFFFLRVATALDHLEMLDDVESVSVAIVADERWPARCKDFREVGLAMRAEPEVTKHREHYPLRVHVVATHQAPSALDVKQHLLGE